jgi:hypothetical protein
LLPPIKIDFSQRGSQPSEFCIVFQIKKRLGISRCPGGSQEEKSRKYFQTWVTLYWRESGTRRIGGPESTRVYESMPGVDEESFDSGIRSGEVRHGRGFF